MASRPRKAQTVDSSTPWFGRHLRKRTPPELRGYEFSEKRKLKKLLYDENGEDVRLVNPGVNWKVLSELRATYKEGYEEAVKKIFDKLVATMLATSRLSTQQNLVLDIHPQVVRNTRSQRSSGRKPAKDISQAGSQEEKALYTSESEGVPMETTATCRATRSKITKGHHNQKAKVVTTESELAIGDLHPIVDLTNTDHRQSTRSHTKKDSVLHPIVDLTNTPYQRSTRSDTRKDSVPMGKNDDQNTEPGLATAPPATEREVPIQARRNSKWEVSEEGAKPHLPQPQSSKRVTRARKQKCDSSRKSEETHAPETVVSDGAESVVSQYEASISERMDSLPSTAVKRSARARTRRQKVQLGSDSTTDTSDVCPEMVPSAPSTKRVTRLRARTGKAPTGDASISDWDSSLVDTASHRTTRSRTRRAVPEAEVIVPVHQHSSRVSDGVEIITEARSGDNKTSSEADHTKTSSEAGHTKTSSEAGHTKTSSEAGHTKTSSEADHAKTSSEPDNTKLNNEAQEDMCGVSEPTLAEQSPQVPEIQTTPSDMKPSEPPTDKINSPQPHPEQIEAAGVRSPSHILSAVSSSSDVTTDCSYAADTEDECVPSKRPRASKRLPLKLKKKRKKKRKASTATKQGKVESESEEKTLNSGDTTEAGRVEAEAPANLADSLYEPCHEDVETPNCTSACPRTEELSTQLKVSTKASRIPPPTKSTGSNSVPTPQTYTKSRPALSPVRECTEPNPTLSSTPQASILSRPAPSTPQTYVKLRPGPSPTVPAPQTSTCTKSKPALSPTIPVPQTSTCTKSKPALSPTIPAPQTSTCTKSKPALSPAIPAPQTSTCTKSKPALSPAIPAPQMGTCTKSKPALSPTIPAPQMGTCTKSKPALSPTIPAPQMGTCTKSKPALSPAIPAPQMGTCTKLRPTLSPTSVPYLMGTPKTIKMLQEEHCTQNRSNVVSFSELMASKGRTPQSPRVVTTVTKTCKSPAKPSLIPVPVPCAQLRGAKRLRSVSLEKLPHSLRAKRPSNTLTPDSTHTESTTPSSEGTESSSPDSVGSGVDSQEFFPTPDTPFVPTVPIPATPSQLRETDSSESFTSSSASSSEKTDQSETTPHSVDSGDSQNVHVNTSPSQLRQPGVPSSGMSTSTRTGNLKDNRTVTKTKMSMWDILEKGGVSKLTFHAPSDLPVSFLPHSPLRKQDTLEERLMKRVEKVQQKKEEVEKRKRELEAKKQRELQDKIRRREERAKRVAENQALKQREEEERKRRAQGQWVHEEQVKRITQKKAKEMEERNRKNKERMQAAEERRRQEDELKKRHLQQIQEDRRMAEEIARKRLEQEEEEKRQRRQEKLKLERERQLQREREAEMRRLQEEEDRQEEQRRQEELRKMQDQARKEEEKRKFEKLLTGSGSKFMKPPALPPSQPASSTSRFIQQWKQLKTQAGDFFSTVTKSKPPPGQQISPPQEECSVLNSTFTKDAGSELTTSDATTEAPVTQSSATPDHNSKIGKKHTPITSYQMTPIQDDPLYDNYDIGNLNSEDSTDDDECPRKQIPTWAQPQFLNTWIQSQEEEVTRNMIDIARLFPPEELLKEPDLAKIFRKKRKRFFDRTSSAQWTSPMLKKSRAECP